MRVCDPGVREDPRSVCVCVIQVCVQFVEKLPRSSSVVYVQNNDGCVCVCATKVTCKPEARVRVCEGGMRAAAGGERKLHLLRDQVQWYACRITTGVCACV